MKKVDGKQTILTWNSKKYGVCEAVIWDGKLTDFRFCIEGSSLTTGVFSHDIEYLKELHKVLGELFVVLKELPPSAPNLPELEPLKVNYQSGEFYSQVGLDIAAIKDKIADLIIHVKKLEAEK